MNTAKTTQRIVITALFASIICVVTMVIKVPSPLNGYLNLGDCFVLLAGWMLPPMYGFAAAGLGSALADVFSGYAVYAPATFVIKGIMALVSYFIFRALQKKLGNFPSKLISGTAAESVMILGYFAFEGVLYGFAPSAVNIPANGVQGIFGLILGCVLVTAIEKSKIPILKNH